MNYWSTATLNTAILIVGVVLLTSLIALPLAWLTERSDLPGANFFRNGLTLPYVIPSTLLAVSWITLANPGVGWLNTWLQNLGIESFSLNIYGIKGVIFIESSALFSILYLSLRAGFARLDPSLEESARLAGASPFRVFLSISLPILRNSVLLGVLTVGLACFASFGVPAIIGTPARVFTLTTAIYSLLQQGSMDSYGQALSVAWKMVVFSLLVAISMRFLTSRKQGFMGSKTNRPALVPLGSLRYPAAFVVGGLWFVMVALPLVALVISSFQVDLGSFAPSNFGFQAWRKVLFLLPEFPISVRNSLVTAVVAAAVVSAFSMLVAILKWHSNHFNQGKIGQLCRWIEEFSFATYSLPGTLLALLLLTGSSKLGAVTSGSVQLTNTLFIITFAFVLKYLALGLNTLTPNAQLIHSSLIESAQLSGAGVFARFRYIWLPLLKPALLAAALLVLMPCLAELTMTLLLYGPRTQNLGVLLFEQLNYADQASASVVGTLLLIAVVLLRFCARRFQRVA